MINCKVINGEAVAAQHRLLVMDCEIQRGKKRKPEQATPRIKWWRLKEDDLKVQFREKVLDKVRPVENVQEWWEETSTTILRVGQEVLGMTTGRRPPGDKETWWWNDKVQEVMLSPYLFAMIMDVLARGIKDLSPWCVLYADDIVLCGTGSEVVEKKLEEWRRAMEDRGLKINRTKTVYLGFGVDGNLDGGSDVDLQGQSLERVNTFEYLGATLAEDGDLDAEMTHRIQSGWRGWKRVSGILCDRRISLRVKGKVYKTVVRPAMMYGAETWAVKKAQEKKLDVAEMRMLRWMSGVTKLDRIRNERIRGTTKVGEISKKVQESRLKWYGHVLRREEEYVGKRVMAMEVPGKRRRGRPKRRWMDSIRNDLSEKELSREDTQDRAKWRSLMRNIDPT